MSETGEQETPTPEVAAEVERQAAAILRGTQYGDENTRATMERELRAKLSEAVRDQRPLRAYLGVDPTSPDLHLGHCVSLRKLRLFQDLGHQAILVIGDFTALVGDPSDKNALRPMNSAEQIAENAGTYQEQAFKILDPERTEVRYNSEWLDALNFRDVIELASNYTVQQFVERDTFATRIEAQQPVYLHEFMYGLMQAQDALKLKTDIQLGGTDQTFNIMAGRTLQRVHEDPPQVAVLSPILVGTDGSLRMSKSTGNYIGIDEPANEQYGKAMSVPDSAIGEFLTLGTKLSAEEADRIVDELEKGTLHPLEAKKLLARAIVSEWHGETAADEAAAYFERVFAQREAPEEIPVHAVAFAGELETEVALADLLAEAGLAASKAEAKRLVGQGAVSINDQKVEQPQATLRPGDVLKVGRRRWLRITAS